MSALSEHVSRLAQAVKSQGMPLEAFLALVLPLLSAARARIAVQAEKRLCEQVNVDPFGLRLPDKSDHYRASLTTALEDSPSSVGALVEAIEADSEQAAQVKAMKIHKIERYRFVASPDACDKCKSDHGKTYPITKKPSHHNNCKCVAQPLGESND